MMFLIKLDCDTLFSSVTTKLNFPALVKNHIYLLDLRFQKWTSYKLTIKKFLNYSLNEFLLQQNLYLVMIDKKSRFCINI